MSIEDDSLICPITQEVFRDPVIAEDGRLYEREAITRWIIEHGTSPFTRQQLDVNHLQPDDEVRKKAEQRRRLSVSYNRESNIVHFPSIQPANNNITLQRIPDWRPLPRRNNRPIHYDCSCWARNKYVICVYICVAMCILIPIIVTAAVVSAQRNTRTTTTAYPMRNNIPLPPNLCRPLNTTFLNSSCLNSSTSITTLDSGTCNNFTYQRVQYCFTTSRSILSIFFAFQQTTGYWDLENIELKSSRNVDIFRNGAFETGSLFPHYTQCQSTGYIRATNSSNSRYCYSDGTQGSFGYLAQGLFVNINSRYCLSLDLQNRNGTGGSFMIVLGN